MSLLLWPAYLDEIAQFHNKDYVGHKEAYFSLKKSNSLEIGLVITQFICGLLRQRQNNKVAINDFLLDL